MAHDSGWLDFGLKPSSLDPHLRANPTQLWPWSFVRWISVSFRPNPFSTSSDTSSAVEGQSFDLFIPEVGRTISEPSLGQDGKKECLLELCLARNEMGAPRGSHSGVGDLRRKMIVHSGAIRANASYTIFIFERT